MAIHANKYVECSSHDLQSVSQVFDIAVDLAHLHYHSSASKISLFQRIVRVIVKQQKSKAINNKRKSIGNTSNNSSAKINNSSAETSDDGSSEDLQQQQQQQLWMAEDRHTNLPLDCFKRASLKSLFKVESVLGSGTEGTVYLCTPIQLLSNNYNNKNTSKMNKANQQQISTTNQQATIVNQQVGDTKSIPSKKYFAVKQVLANNRETALMLLNQVTMIKSLKCNSIVEYEQCFYDIWNGTSTISSSDNNNNNNNNNSIQYMVYIVMEHCSDGTLHQLINDLKSTHTASASLSSSALQFSNCDLIYIAYQLALGINKIHSLRLMHRDLKSANILLHGSSIKIGDFGRLKQFEKNRTMSIAGSFTTVAPEVMYGSKYYNQSADIFSYGCILYECITLRSVLMFNMVQQQSETQLHGQMKQLMKSVRIIIIIVIICKLIMFSNFFIACLHLLLLHNFFCLGFLLLFRNPYLSLLLKSY